MRRLLPIALNQLGAVLFGLAGIKVVSQIVPPAVYGSYALFVTLTQLGPMLTHSGLSNHTARYWQREQPLAAAYGWFLWRRSWWQAGLLVPMLALTCGAMVMARREWIWAGMLPLLILSNAILGIYNVALAALNASEKFWRMFTLATLANAARVFLPLLFAALGGASLLQLSTGFSCHGLVVLACIVGLFRWVRPAEEPGGALEERWGLELRRYGRPFIAMGVGSWLLANADRWVVVSCFGEEAAGLFSLASGMASVVPTLAMGGLMQLVFPKAFRQADAAQTGADWARLAKWCDQITLLFLGLTAAGLLVLWLASPYLLGSLISMKYAPALAILAPTGCGVLTAQVNQFQYLLLQGQHNSLGMVKVMAVTAGVKTLGSLVAALISWEAFLGWLFLSVLVNWVVGRAMIRHLALSPLSAPVKGPAPAAKTEPETWTNS